MKFILPASSVRPLENGMVEVDVVPLELIQEVSKRAGDNYTAVYAEWTQASEQSVVAESIRIYNNRIRSGAICSTPELALKSMFHAEKLRDEISELRKKADELEAFASSIPKEVVAA